MRSAVIACIVVLTACSSSDSGRSTSPPATSQDCGISGVIVGGFGDDVFHAAMGFLDPCGDGRIELVPDITRLSLLHAAGTTIVLSHAPTTTDQLVIWDEAGQRPGPTGFTRAFAPSIAHSGRQFAVTIPTDQGNVLAWFSLPDGEALGTHLDSGDIDLSTWLGEDRVAYIRESYVGGSESRDVILLDIESGTVQTVNGLDGLEAPGWIEGNEYGFLAISPAADDDFRTVVVRIGDDGVPQQVATIDGWRVLSWSPDGLRLLVRSPIGELATVVVAGADGPDVVVERLAATPDMPIFMATWIEQRP